MPREEVTSLTVNTETMMLTAVIEAEEGRDVATCNIPNAFIQTEVEDVDQQGNRTVMKIRGIWLISCANWIQFMPSLLSRRNKGLSYTSMLRRQFME
jgi:hypothetical protein